ncbi:hypothetical protein TSUD_237160 [Trifolium subterraneum]|uniref:t-SNARE coiled-coil homology domain-containing protein n=1 Tax=Trifolium subterraneum TaxID=3900 RepID=A0A2Z6NCQ3_TRISU|nr:hypothetical protein TSUD_237160 [Trifolium subterraneum]
MNYEGIVFVSFFPDTGYALITMSFQDIQSGRRNLINGKQDPTQAVASGVFQINTAVSTFQRLVNTLGTPKDTPELREKLHKTRLHIGQLVKDTSDKLKQASEIDHHADINRGLFFLPCSYTVNEAGVGSDKSQEQQALLVESRRQEVISLDNEISFNEAIIEEREQGIQEIQQQIGEVNEIFKDLAVLVHEQGAMIDDIGTNIENSHEATVQAKSQLVQAAKTQRSNSSLACLLLVIFGIVLLIIIIIVASPL